MSFIKEFKEFAFKGNVIDLAVGVVIGAAFGAVVKSLVDNIITPGILDPVLKAANVKDVDKLLIPGTAIKYGAFIAELITFILVAFALFLFIKLFNRLKRKEADTKAAYQAPQPSKEEVLLAEIRDILKAK